MNELSLSMFEIFVVTDLILIAYNLYKLNFNEEVKVDKIISSLLASSLSFILSRYIVNGEVVQTYADSNGFHYIPFQSLPIHYFLLGLAVMMGILFVVILIKYVSDHFENAEKHSSLGDWQHNSFSRR